MAKTNKPKRLYRSESDKMIGGVCGGLSQYFDIDPALVRLVFVIGLVLGVSSSFWIYLILWLILPTESAVTQASNEHIQNNVEEMKDTVTKMAKGIQSAVTGNKTKE